MKTGYSCALAGAAFLALAGHADALRAAEAYQPLVLSEVQMDDVTAGGFAAALGQAASLGDLLSETQALTATAVNNNVSAAAQTRATALAASVYFDAASAARSQAAATLP